MVVAVSDPKVQMDRLLARNPELSPEDAQNRVISQGDVREKAKHALMRGEKRGVVVWNDGDQDDLKREVARVMGEVERASPQWWAYACLFCPPLGVAAAGWTVLQNWRAQREWAAYQRSEKARL